MPFNKAAIQYAADKLLSSDELAMWEAIRERFDSLSHAEQVAWIEKLFSNHSQTTATP